MGTRAQRLNSLLGHYPEVNVEDEIVSVIFSSAVQLKVMLCTVSAPGVPQQEVDELRSRLQQVEEQNSDLKERLTNTTTNLEQYRSMVLSLEESVNKEKQVLICFNLFSCF